MLQQLHTVGLKWWQKRATCTRHAAGWRGIGKHVRRARPDTSSSNLSANAKTKSLSPFFCSLCRTGSAPKTFHSLDVLFPATARSICLPLAAKILCASSSKAFKSTCGSAAKAAFLPPPGTPPVTVKIIDLPRKPSRRTDVAGAVSKRLNLCAADCAQRRRSRDVWDS